MSVFLYGLIIACEALVNKRYRWSKSSSTAILTLLICAFGLVGCQRDESEKQKKTVLVLDWFPNPNHIPIYAGLERGFFADEGINLEVLKTSDVSNGIPNLMSDRVDLCLTYMPETISAMLRGIPITPVGILVEEPLNSFIFRADAGIQKPEDLSGKVIGYSVDGYETKKLEFLLGNRHVKPKALYNANFDLVGMVATGVVDVIYGAFWNIESENLAALGIRTNHFTVSEFGEPPYCELIFIAHANSKESGSVFIAAFQRAIQRSIDFSVDRPKEAFEDYLKANPDKNVKTIEWEWKAWLVTIPMLAKKQDTDAGMWKNFVEWMKRSL